jgi:hypothetical protein
MERRPQMQSAPAANRHSDWKNLISRVAKKKILRGVEK